MKLVLKILILAAAVLILGAPSVRAAEVKSGNEIVPSNTTENLYVAANTATLAGTYEKDVLIASGTVMVSGNVKDDLLIAGGTVTVAGNIGGNLQIAGGTLTISGKIDGDVLLFGGNVQIASSASIGGDLDVYSGTLAASGVIKGDVRAYGGTIQINGPVSKNVQAKASQLVIGSNAKIDGNVRYTSPQPATINTGSKISGTVSYNMQAAAKHGNLRIYAKVISAITFFLIAILVLLIAGHKLINLNETIDKKFWTTVVTGLLVTIFAPFGLFILMVTVIGIPIAILLGILYGLIVYLGKISVGLYIGEKILKALLKKDKIHPVWAGLLGVILIILVTKISYIGGIISFLATILGVGIWSLSIGHYLRKEKKTA